MNHPGKYLIEELKSKDLTQKVFSLMLGKKVSELNELIKGKRNITVQRDILLSQTLGTPEKYWIYKQIDYDYYKAKIDLESKLQNRTTNSFQTTGDGNSISIEKEKPIYISISNNTKKDDETKIDKTKLEGIFMNF